MAEKSQENRTDSRIRNEKFEKVKNLCSNIRNNHLGTIMFLLLAVFAFVGSSVAMVKCNTGQRTRLQKVLRG